MAVTKGHGNPAWSTDETVLALELYLNNQDKIPGTNHPDVIELSKTLNKLPIHPIQLRRNSFRNPDGVAFKIQNIRSVATGKGLSNTSKTDKLVWDTFGHLPEAVKELAKQIRETSSSFGDTEVIIYDFDDEEAFPEGLVLTAFHKKRERAKGIRPTLLKKRKSENTLHCDVCGTKPLYTNFINDHSIFECHHIVPLHQIGKTKTKLSDMALLCANCHKAIHAYISNNKSWVTPEEFRVLINL